MPEASLARWNTPELRVSGFLLKALFFSFLFSCRFSIGRSGTRLLHDESTQEKLLVTTKIRDAVQTEKKSQTNQNLDLLQGGIYVAALLKNQEFEIRNEKSSTKHLFALEITQCYQGRSRYETRKPTGHFSRLF